MSTKKKTAKQPTMAQVDKYLMTHKYNEAFLGKEKIYCRKYVTLKS